MFAGIATQSLLFDNHVVNRKPASGIFFAGHRSRQETPHLTHGTRWGKCYVYDEPVSGELFPGQYFDEETGLHYNYFRDYDPSIGRYAQSDPIGFAGGINSYSYTDANPIRQSDRFGLSSVAVFVRPAPVIVRPLVRPRPSIEQRPGESISQFTRRLEQGIRDRARNGIPRITQNPFRLPRQAPTPGGDRVGGLVRLLNNLRQFLRDLSEFEDLGGVGGSPIPLPVAPAPLSGPDDPRGACPLPPTRLSRECFELGLCV
jgi:RHS repeat-associated protein